MVGAAQSGLSVTCYASALTSSENQNTSLNTVKRSPDAQNENRVSSIARKRWTKTLCRLLPIYSRLPKLNGASSNPHHAPSRGPPTATMSTYAATGQHVHLLALRYFRADQ
jgi:hypothetical protein